MSSADGWCIQLTEVARYRPPGGRGRHLLARRSLCAGHHRAICHDKLLLPGARWRRATPALLRWMSFEGNRCASLLRLFAQVQISLLDDSGNMFSGTVLALLETSATPAMVGKAIIMFLRNRFQ